MSRTEIQTGRKGGRRGEGALDMKESKEGFRRADLPGHEAGNLIRPGRIPTQRKRMQLFFDSRASPSPWLVCAFARLRTATPHPSDLQHACLTGQRGAAKGRRSGTERHRRKRKGRGRERQRSRSSFFRPAAEGSSGPRPLPSPPFRPRPPFHDQNALLFGTVWSSTAALSTLHDLRKAS